jgi:hypothetical protein
VNTFSTCPAATMTAWNDDGVMNPTFLVGCPAGTY